MVTQVIGNYADIHDWNNLYVVYRKAARGACARHIAS